MVRSRIPRILATFACIAAGLASVFHFVHREPSNAAAQERFELYERAEHRFNHGRGLSPCDRLDRDLVSSAWSYLRRVGEPAPEVIALTVPTFSEITLTTFRPNYVQTQKLVGHTGFGPPSAEWFSSKPEPVALKEMTAEEYTRVVSSLSRHILFPMTAPVYGHDGVRYYFGIGEEGCATTWSPRGGGPADLIVRIIAAFEQANSMDEVTNLARAIEEADRAR